MRFLLVALASLAFAASGASKEARWSLVQAIGEVVVEEPGFSRMAVKPNAKLNEGATITTGANGRAILTDGRSSITVNAGSRVELPAANDENVTSIRQDFGSALFKVQKKPTAHFEVQTPYLAAVVKGTTFVVTVDAMGASVDVEEGLVEVGSALDDERVLVPRGERVRVLQNGQFENRHPGVPNRTATGQTTAALNVIEVEITSEEVKTAADDQAFAALKPSFERSADHRDGVDVDNERVEVKKDATSPSGEASLGRPELLPQPREPGAGGDNHNTGENGNDVGNDENENKNDNENNADNRNKINWTEFASEVKRAYAEWKANQEKAKDKENGNGNGNGNSKEKAGRKDD